MSRPSVKLFCKAPLALHELGAWQVATNSGAIYALRDVKVCDGRGYVIGEHPKRDVWHSVSIRDDQGRLHNTKSPPERNPWPGLRKDMYPDSFSELLAI